VATKDIPIEYTHIQNIFSKRRTKIIDVPKHIHKVVEHKRLELHTEEVRVSSQEEFDRVNHEKEKRIAEMEKIQAKLDEEYLQIVNAKPKEEKIEDIIEDIPPHINVAVSPNHFSTSLTERQMKQHQSLEEHLNQHRPHTDSTPTTSLPPPGTTRSPYKEHVGDLYRIISIDSSPNGPQVIQLQKERMMRTVITVVKMSEGEEVVEIPRDIIVYDYAERLSKQIYTVHTPILQ